MAKKVSEGVGKKIVEALKKQSEIEVNPISAEDEADNLNVLDELNQSEISENIDDVFGEEFAQELADDADISDFAQAESDYTEAPGAQLGKTFTQYQQPSASIHDSFISELDTFEIPSNIAVLKKLISQLPSGVSRHTGAQIIKQTMEALGISMKSVLQEAQQVQDGLNNSAKECFSTIQEYKKQIITLEKQAQNHQRQYSALNELISLFIQTGV